jgi:hypothetical protein
MARAKAIGAALLTTLVITAGAAGAPLPIGTTLAAPFGTAGESGAAIPPSLTSAFSAPGIAGTVTSEPFREAGGTVDLDYRVGTLNGSAGVMALLAGGFAPGLGIAIADVRADSTGVAPSSVTYRTDGFVEFDFASPIANGASSALLVLELAPAPGSSFNFAPTRGFVEGAGEQAAVIVLAATPSPEPPSAVLLGLGLAVGAVAGRIRRRARAASMEAMTQALQQGPQASPGVGGRPLPARQSR